MTNMGTLTLKSWNQTAFCAFFSRFSPDFGLFNVFLGKKCRIDIDEAGFVGVSL